MKKEKLYYFFMKGKFGSEWADFSIEEEGMKLKLESREVDPSIVKVGKIQSIDLTNDLEEKQ